MRGVAVKDMDEHVHCWNSNAIADTLRNSAVLERHFETSSLYRQEVFLFISNTLLIYIVLFCNKNTSEPIVR